VLIPMTCCSSFLMCIDADGKAEAMMAGKIDFADGKAEAMLASGMSGVPCLCHRDSI
jgi:hypothetical protein